jgi:hypothetical protein
MGVDRGNRRALPACALVGLLAAPALAAAGTAGNPESIRFSALTELTPQNVRGLRPLSSLRLQLAGVRPGSDAPRVLTRDSPAEAATVEDVDRVGSDLGSWDSGGSAGRMSAAVSYILGASNAAGVPGQLTAWDPVKRRPVWVVREDLTAGAGALLTAGGLVFYEGADGWLKALDARTGEMLWKHRTGDHRLASAKTRGPISYRGPGGHQYVAVLTGAHGTVYQLHAFALPH